MPENLAYSLVTSRDGHPSRSVLFLHGILGSRSNWRGTARRWVSARPDWGAVLVDLRKHGDSQDFPPPHTVESAAADLATLKGAVDNPVCAVLGHSFGGKVALAYADARSEPLDELWVIDSNPGARPGGRGSEGTLAVLSTLESMPRRWDSREAFVSRIVEAGYEEMLGQWLAMNLQHQESGYELRLDLDAVRALLEDYFARDLWHVVEEPRGGTRVHLVIGARSSVFDAEARERARRAALANEQVELHVLDAGHWVHMEAGDALADLFAAEERRGISPPSP